LIFDLPPGTGDIQLTLVQKIPLTGAVIVTTPQEISLADVRRSIAMFEKVKVDILGVVENMSYFTPPDMPNNKYYIFGQGGGEKISKEFNVDFLGEVPLDINMREYNDSGMPIVERDLEHPQSQIIMDIARKVMSKNRQVNYLNETNADLEISI
jgi:ATP-binding protein involved in chromosome partitioning